MRSMFSIVAPRHNNPVIMSKMPRVMTTFASSPNCARISVIPANTQLTTCLGIARELIFSHGTAAAANLVICVS